jgi:hypothetical protein
MNTAELLFERSGKKPQRIVAEKDQITAFRMLLNVTHVAAAISVYLVGPHP